MQPSVSRMVHYVSYGTPNGEYKPECRAAVIASVIDETTVDLVVFNPGGLFFNNRCQYSDEPKGGTWHWPERV